MSKRDHLTMDAFSPAHQPDEGYSEDPLYPTIHNELSAALSSLKSPEELPAWITANTAHLPMSLKKEITMALLSELPTSVISEIVQQLNPRLYIDFIRYLPPEICLKILSYLDPTSLVSVIRTCRAWCDLALDSKLWERLYHLEGWKAIQSEIKTSEAKVNVGLNDSIGHLHRIQNSEGHTNKIRALLNDDDGDDADVAMSDSDRMMSATGSPGRSLFGSPNSSFSSNRAAVTPFGEMDVDSQSSKSKADRSFGLSESRAKRRAMHTTPDASLPPILPPKDPRALRRSTLWMWDGSQSRYRINWKYLYNMRRRLESNWELCKAVTFQLPHPNHPEEGHNECIYSFQFDANFLVSGSRDQTMRIWNIHTRRLIRHPLIGHNGSVLCLQFDADPDEDLLVSGSSDSNIIIWKFSTGEMLQKISKAHRESVLNVRFDKRVLVSSSKDKSIKIFNRRPLRYGDQGYREDLFGLATRRVRAYGYELELAQELPVIPSFSIIGRLDGHGAAVNAIQVRDQTVVSVSGDRHIKIWNWPAQTCTQTIPAHDKGIACVEFDGRRIVSGSSDYEVCIFDAPTGLKVAQLRGHANLVRTVQAGFGDFPYSQTEDELEARRIDSEFFKAVEAGLVEHNSSSDRTQRDHRPNAGSSRPVDLQAYGAKLPPGGGGGRTYGRIVSGSYDQSIIIWRRDKEGVWKPAHHLRQEEAAAAAQRRESLLAEQNNTAPGIASIPSQPMRPLVQPPPASATGQELPSSSATSTLPLPNVHDSQPHLSSGVYTALIDQVVPAGAHALQQALTNYPGMLTYHSYLQVTIERESSPNVRAQLRQIVADAVVSLQNNQWARRPIAESQPSNHSAGATAGSAVSLNASAMVNNNPEATSSALVTPQPPPAQALVPTPALEAPNLTHAQPSMPPLLPTQAHEIQAQAALHQAHIPAPENTPARVFKLQFDARKIVCCSQAPVIVGWDFCNGDPELEAASRFFATVD